MIKTDHFNFSWKKLTFIHQNNSPFCAPHNKVFKGPPQESQSGPAFAKTGTEAFVMSRGSLPLPHLRYTNASQSFPHGGTWYKKPFQ
jgi:hypothetical protein